MLPGERIPIPLTGVQQTARVRFDVEPCDLRSDARQFQSNAISLRLLPLVTRPSIEIRDRPRPNAAPGLAWTEAPSVCGFSDRSGSKKRTSMPATHGILTAAQRLRQNPHRAWLHDNALSNCRAQRRIGEDRGARLGEQRAARQEQGCEKLGFHAAFARITIQVIA